jgi:catechol 2,3-dioxygenase-like lactoylglutathione lyase family enzyme
VNQAPLNLATPRLLVRVHAYDIDASVRFYERLRFTVQQDEVFGGEVRSVQMTSPALPNLILIVRDLPARAAAALISTQEKLKAHDFALALIVDDYLDWMKHLQLEGIPIVHEESHPYGIWIYIRDPAGNLIELTIFDRY